MTKIGKNSTGSQKLIDLSVVLPAYLEEENLRLLIPRIQQTLERLSCSSEVLVIDTETPLDRTEAVCQENKVRYVRRTGGNFFGDAIRTGIEAANGNKILFMDADGSHAPEFISDLYTASQGYDVTIASRYIDGGLSENSRILILMSWVLNWSYAWVLNLKCKDVSNSFKIYDAAQLKALDLRSKNFDIVEEIFFKLKILNPDLKIKEIPFSFKKRMFGETKRNLVTFIITFVVTLIRLRFFMGAARKKPALLDRKYK